MDTMADNTNAASSLSSNIRTCQAYIYDRIVSDELLSEDDLSSFHALLDSQICIVLTSDCDCYQALFIEFYRRDDPSQMIKNGHCPCTHDMGDTDQHIVRFHFTHVAAILGKHLFLKQLLDHGCVLESRMLPSNWTPLIYAVRHKYPKCIDLILKYCESNLSLASEMCNSVATTSALCKGNDDDRETKQPENACQNESGNISLAQNVQSPKDTDSQDYMLRDCLDMIFFAVDLDSYILERLFNSGKCFIPKNIQHRKTYQLLVQALLQNSANLSLLLGAGADPNAANITGTTPLFYVVHNYYRIENCSAIIKVLVKAGASVNLHNDNDETPLLAAIVQGNEEIVDILLEFGADPNYFNSNGFPALTLATFQSPGILKSLIKHGAHINATNADHCYSALHMAAWEGQLEAVDFLLEANASVDEQTKDKNTPLSLAAHGNYERMVKRFLELGVCDVNNADKDLDTPLIYATFNDNVEMVDMLLTHGADPHMPNSLMCTPLWNAVYSDNLQNVRRLLLCNVELEVCSVGIDQHAIDDNIRHIYQHPRSPLWIATMHGNRKIVQLLLLVAYNLQKETWIRTDGVLDMSAEFDINFEDPDVITEHLLPFVRRHCSSPLTLLNICSRFFRSTFRKNLKYVTEQLPIPATLKAHLNIEFI